MAQGLLAHSLTLTSQREPRKPERQLHCGRPPRITQWPPAVGEGEEEEEEGEIKREAEEKEAMLAAGPVSEVFFQSTDFPRSYRCCTAWTYIDPPSSRSWTQCSPADTRTCRRARRPLLCTCHQKSRLCLHTRSPCPRTECQQNPSGTRTDSRYPSPAKREKEKII